MTTDDIGTDRTLRARISAFATLFDDPRPSAWCGAHEVLTPRNAAQLWAAAIRLAHVLDEQLDDIRQPVYPCGSEWRRMPFVAVGESPDWYGQFIDCVVSLADDVASGRCPIPRCTAEEVALHLMLEDIVEPEDRGVAEVVTSVTRGLPVREWDEEWDEVAASLFPCPLVRRLLADGLVHCCDDDYELVAETGLVRLAVNRWFEPLDELTPTRPTLACDCGQLP